MAVLDKKAGMYCWLLHWSTEIQIRFSYAEFESEAMLHKKKKNFILPMILLRCSGWDFHGKGFSIFLVFSCHSSRISLLSSLVEWNDCVFFRWFTILKRRKLNLDHSRLLIIFSLDLKKKKKDKRKLILVISASVWSLAMAVVMDKLTELHEKSEI